MKNMSQFFRVATPGLLIAVVMMPVLSIFMQLADYTPRDSVIQDAALISKGFLDTDFKEVSLGQIPVYVEDRISDCVTLGHMFSESDVPFGSRPQFPSEEPSPCFHLSSTLPLTEENTTKSYARFWHGSSAVLLLAGQLVPLHEFRLLIGSLTIGLALLLSYRLLVLNFTLAVPIVITIFLGTDLLFAGFSFSQGLSVGAMMLALVVLAFSNPLLPSRVALLSSISGLLYSFLAQLFYPMAFALLFQMVVGTTRSRQPKESISGSLSGSFPSGFLALGFWIFGYGFGMASRFVDIALRATPSVAIAEFQSSVENKDSFNLEPVLRAGYHHLLGSLPQYSLRWLAIITLTFALGYFIARLNRAVLRSILPLVGASLLPVVLWILVFSGHHIHGWVANVSLTILCFIVWLFAYSSVRRANEPSWVL